MLGSNRKCLFCFFPSRSSSLFLVELCLPVALLSLFLCPSLSLYSKFVDMTINLSLILALDNTYTETFSAFRFRLYWLYSCVSFTRRGWPLHTLSRQNKMTFGVGLHEVCMIPSSPYYAGSTVGFSFFFFFFFFKYLRHVRPHQM